MELQGNVGHVESHFGPLVSVRDSCTIYTKHIVGLEIVLDAPDGTPR
jgi:hypothetical protein